MSVLQSFGRIAPKKNMSTSQENKMSQHRDSYKDAKKQGYKTI
jgi:hypothetical protein